MKKLLTLTIDVEPDCSSNWLYSDPLTFTGVSNGIALRLQPLFNKYGIVPTYLVNNVVLENDESIDVFNSLEGKYELGTHLHPEFIEPQKEQFSYAGKKGVANCCFYEPETEYKKIANITTLFEKKFGYPPSCFRAGRFSAGNNTIKSLQKLNYKVDSSVTPNIRWDDKTRPKPVDFRFAPQQPYWIENEITQPAAKGKGLLEVPVSIARKKLSLIKYIRQAVIKKRIPFKGSEPKWLRPVFSGMQDFKMILTAMENHNSNHDTVVYNMMFHNVEVMPGLSPYSKTEKDCENYLQLLETFFQYTNKHNIDSIGLSGLYEIFR